MLVEWMVKDRTFLLTDQIGLICWCSYPATLNINAFSINVLLGDIVIVHVYFKKFLNWRISYLKVSQEFIKEQRFLNANSFHFVCRLLCLIICKESTVI